MSKIVHFSYFRVKGYYQNYKSILTDLWFKILELTTKKLKTDMVKNRLSRTELRETLSI